MMMPEKAGGSAAQTTSILRVEGVHVENETHNKDSRRHDDKFEERSHEYPAVEHNLN